MVANRKPTTTTTTTFDFCLNGKSELVRIVGGVLGAARTFQPTALKCWIMYYNCFKVLNLCYLIKLCYCRDHGDVADNTKSTAGRKLLLCIEETCNIWWLVYFIFVSWHHWSFVTQ